MKRLQKVEILHRLNRKSASALQRVGEDAAISLECLTCAVCPQNGVSVFSAHSSLSWSSHICVCVFVCVSPTQKEKGGGGCSSDLDRCSTATVSSFCRVRITAARLAAITHVYLRVSECLCVCTLISVSMHFLICWDCVRVCVCVRGGLAGDSDERNCNRRPPAGVEP